MLVIIPVVSPDRSCSIPNLMDAMERACQKFPPGANHTLLVVASPDARSLSEVLVNKLQPYFAQSSSETFVANHSLGWPRENNFYFQQSCFLLPKYVKPNQGFLYMELDCVPLTANWLTLIEQEYYFDVQAAQAEKRNPRRFLGTTESTFKNSYGEKVVDGFHMIPSGVYPGDFDTCPVLKSVAGVANHFSIHIKWYPIKGLNNSPFFQNNRQTVNYREADGNIVCDSIADTPWDIHWNDPIKDTAVILRGCLDGSLIDALPKTRVANIPAKSVSQPKESTTTAAVNPHPPLKRPTEIKRFGELANGGNRSQVKFDEITGFAKPEETPQLAAEVVQEVTPEPAPELPAEAPPTPPAPASYRKKKRNGTWTPERRARMAELARERFHKKPSIEATPEPAPC